MHDELLPIPRPRRFDRNPATGGSRNIVRATDVVGEKWMLAILFELFMGARGFNQIQRNLGISRAVLAARIRTAVAAGLVARVHDPYDGRAALGLTELGQRLWPVIVGVSLWTETLSAPDGSHRVVHTACGAAGELRITCSGCGEAVGGPEGVVIEHRAEIGGLAPEPRPGGSA